MTIRRATFRDGNLETEIFPSLNRDGNCFSSLNRDGNCFPCLNRDGKISVSKFPSLFFNFLVVVYANIFPKLEGSKKKNFQNSKVPEPYVHLPVR